MIERNKLRLESPTPLRLADVAIRNARVYTVDATRPWASAVAICADRIVYVGDDQGLKDHLGPETRVIDAQGKLVLPGFVESHWHLCTTALAYQAWVNYEDPQKVLQAVRSYAEEHPDEPAITGMGWIFPLMPPELLTKETLDTACADRPVILFCTDMHAAWANTKALEIAGITKDTPPVIEGCSWFEKDAVTGEPTGLIIEPAACGLILEALGHGGYMPRGKELYTRSFKSWIPKLSSAGITTLFDAAFFDASGDQSLLFETLESLAEKDELHLRVVGSFAVSSPGVDAIPQLTAMRARYNSDLVTARCLKVLLDGVEHSHTAYLLEPYSDLKDNRGEPMLPYEDAFRLIQEADLEGIDVMVHAVGDAAVRMALDIFESVFKVNPPRDRRHVITHAWMTHDTDIPRFRQLGIIANTQLQWGVVDDYNDLIRERIGPDRMDRMYRFRKFIDHGVTVSLGMDALACQCRCQWRPVEMIESGMTRKLAGQPEAAAFPGADQSLSVPQLIAGYTINGAYQLGLEHEIGSLTVGKKADLIVMDRDLFELAPQDIAKAEVLLTLLNGRITHDSGLFANSQAAKEIEVCGRAADEDVPLRRWGCYCLDCLPSRAFSSLTDSADAAQSTSTATRQT